MNPINQRIKDQMDRQGISSHKLGNLTGIAPQTIRGWRSGIRTPRKGSIEVIAHCLDCTADYLIKGEQGD